MKIEKLDARTTLRELMTHAEKCTRDLIGHVQNNVLNHTSDLRDLSRPVRRKSHYPTLITILNAVQRLEGSSEEAMIFTDYLMEQLRDVQKGVHQEMAGR